MQKDFCLWDEKSEKVQSALLQDGWLVKVTIDVVDQADPDLYGYFRGIEEGEGVTRFLLEVPDYKPGYEGISYQVKVRKIYLPHVRLVEIVARERHAAHLVLHSIGCLKRERKEYMQKLVAGCEVLGGRHYIKGTIGYNF